MPRSGVAKVSRTQIVMLLAKKKINRAEALSLLHKVRRGEPVLAIVDVLITRGRQPKESDALSHIERRF